MMKHHQRNELMKPSFISTDIYVCMYVCAVAHCQPYVGGTNCLAETKLITPPPHNANGGYEPTPNQLARRLFVANSRTVTSNWSDSSVSAESCVMEMSPFRSK